MAQFTIKSKSNPTRSSIHDLYTFLSDFNNFEKILPADKVEDFKAAGDRCSFTVRGITAITIRRTESVPDSKVVFSSEGLSKFNFRLTALLEGDPGSPGHCSVELWGELNPFIKAMAEKPLGNLVETMSLKLSELNAGTA